MAQQLFDGTSIDMRNPQTWVTNNTTTNRLRIDSNGAVGPAAPWLTPKTVEDNRPTVVEKPLAIEAEIEAWKIQDANFDVVMKTVVDAGRKLMHACQADTRCGGCERLTYKHEQMQDHMRDTTRIRLTSKCKTLEIPNITVVVCPDGRATSRHGGGATRTLEPTNLEKAVTYHQPPQKEVSVNPDVPKTAMDESW